MNEYQDQIKESKMGAQKDALLKGATGAFGVGQKLSFLSSSSNCLTSIELGDKKGDYKNSIFNTDGKNNDDLLNAANKVQDKTFDATSRIKQKIADSREVGTATLETLQAQRQQVLTYRFAD